MSLQLTGNMSLGFRNIIINGDFRINQRDAASKTEISSAYNYDRWYYNGTDLEQRIEEGNYKPSTTYTLSGTNVTTSQETSPASGTWTINVPTTADNVQLEEGSVATKFEQRPIGLELVLCQRYYQARNVLGAGVQNSATAFLVAVHLPVPMRVVPTVTMKSGVYSNINIEHDDTYDVTGWTYHASAPGDSEIWKTSAFVINMTTTGSNTVGYGGMVAADRNSDYFIMDAEL